VNTLTDKRKSASRTATRDQPEPAGDRVGGSIRLNTFRNARSKTPDAQDLTWAEACAQIRRLTKAQAGAAPPKTEDDRRELKERLPAFNTATLLEPYNVNANVEHLTALPIDVDRGDLVDVHDRAEAAGIACLIYTSPSHPNADGTDRFRVLVPLDAPLAPGDVKHARKALAEMLGIGPGQGVEHADALSQIFFAGRIKGDDERDVVETEGEPVSTAALVGARLVKSWAAAKPAKAAAALDRLGIEDPDERTAALIAALAPHWEAPGESTQRRQVLRALGGYLARRGWTDEQIAAVGRGLETERPEADRLRLMIECARSVRATDGATGAGWTELTKWNPPAAAVIESAAKDPLEPSDWCTGPTKGAVFDSSWRGVYRRRAERAKVTASGPGGAEFHAASSDAPNVPLILRSIDGHVSLLWEGDDRGHRPLAEKNLRLRIRELGFDQSFVALRDDKNRPRTSDTLIEDYGATYERTAYAFANRVTTYDPNGGGSVTIGYPRPMLAARFDDAADEWLKALAGKHYDRLCVWIASCAQANINRLSACLVLVGKKDSGKSMLAYAVARMWSETPPPLSLICAQFNADMTRCPILVDEEAQLFGSKQLSTKKLRDIIQEPARSVERKGKERVQLIGGLRLVVSCNGLSDLRFTDLGGPDVIEALRDRFLVIDALARAEACRAALEKLRPAGGYVVDLDRIAGHMAWIAENADLPAERFLGSGGDGATGAILAGHVEEAIELWENFRDWLGSDTAAGPWHARSGELAVETSALAMALERVGRGWDLPRVQAALRPFTVQRDFQPTLQDGRKPRTWRLDPGQLAAAVGGIEQELRDRLERSKATQGRGRFGKFE